MTRSIEVLNFLAAYSIFLSGMLVWVDRKSIRGSGVILSFLACVFSYLLIDYIDQGALKTILLAGPFLLPFTFWLFARSLFRDTPVTIQQAIKWGLPTLIAYYGLFTLDQAGYSTFTSVTFRLLSLFFVALAVIESQSSKSVDLDSERLRLRKYFVYLIGIIVVITLLVEIGISQSDQEIPRLIQRLAILLLNSLFILGNFSVTNRLLNKNLIKPDFKDQELIEKIQSVILDQQLYRQEKLTIGQLSETIGEQEYKVRRAINYGLGYRNFLDFINSFRIKEAVSMLQDREKSQLTVLEIAYQTGFNSIGPFNRAFKTITGMTPTELRRKHLG